MRDFNMGRKNNLHRHGIAKPIVIGIALVVVLVMLVMSLWNALLPGIVGVKSIGFWQALGLLVLCRILFGGLGVRPGMFGGRRRMHERWMQMTPEQREQFMQHRREGGHHHEHRWHGFHRHNNENRACNGQREFAEDKRAAESQSPEANAQKPAGTE